MGAKYTRKDEAGRVFAKTHRGFDVLIESSAKTMSEEQQRGHGVIFDGDEDDPYAEEPEELEEREEPDPDEEPEDESETESKPEDGDGDGDDEDQDQDVEYPVHIGGPNWELSDGSTVQGSRDVAEEAEAELHKDKDGDGDGEEPEDESETESKPEDGDGDGDDA